MTQKIDKKTPLLTPYQVAELLSCKLSTVYAWAKTGKIPAFKVNGLLRFDPVEIEDWLATHKTRPANSPNTAPNLLKTKGKNHIDIVISNAIESTLEPGYNNPQKGKPDQSARKGGA